MRKTSILIQEEKENAAALKRRNGFEITRDILEVCSGTASKTRIVYAANLNSKRINHYLEFCTRMKLLVKSSNGGSQVYETTPEGKHFLNNYFKSSGR